MTWRLAKSLDTLRAQINEAFPKRRKQSDGTVGDAAHASRASDHNPWVKDGKTGVVTALDITHDPANGVDANAIALALIASRDPRIKYVISNGQIASSTKVGSAAAWTWRKYTGSNPHSKHFHLSVKSSKAQYDSTKPWALDVKAQDSTAATAPIKTAFDPDVLNVQVRLEAMKYFPGEIDGLWGGKTGGAIAGFINDRELAMKAPTSKDDFRHVHKELAAEISKAELEGWTRPIAPERAEATAEELAKKLPQVDAAAKSERTGFWASIATGVSAVITGISQALGDAVEWLKPVQSFVSDVPWPVWIIGALAVSGAIYYASRKSGEAKRDAVESYQTGATS